MRASSSAQDQDLTGHRNRFIDICRGIAILGVIFHHYYFGWIVEAIDWHSVSLKTKIALSLNNGWLGVNLFFILSGWVLYRPNFAFGKGDVVRFYATRARRLLPLLFLFIAILALVEQKDFTLFVKSCALILTGVNNLIPSEWAPVHLRYALWSISVEILFSATLPILILISNKIGFWRFFWSTIGICLVYRVVADFIWFQVHPDFPNRLINPLKDNLVGRIDDFVIGMGVARFISEEKNVEQKYAYVAISVLAISCFGWTYAWFSPRSLMISILASCLHLFFSASIFVIACSVGRLKIWRSLIWSPLALAGTICYSAYLAHTTIIRAFAPAEPTVLMFTLFCAVTFAVSTTLFAFFETATIKHIPSWALLLRNGRVSRILPSGR